MKIYADEDSIILCGFSNDHWWLLW